MDRTGDTVEHLHVELRQIVGLVDAHLLDITLRRGIDDVTHIEALDRFILRNAAGAVAAPDDRGVATAVLRPTVVTALGRHASVFFLLLFLS